MKTIGRTNENNYLVEMSIEEYREFVRLEASVNGSDYYPFFDFNQSLKQTDLSKVFKAFSDLSNAKISIYKLQEYINFLANTFGGYKKDA